MRLDTEGAAGGGICRTRELWNCFLGACRQWDSTKRENCGVAFSGHVGGAGTHRKPRTLWVDRLLSSSRRGSLHREGCGRSNPISHIAYASRGPLRPCSTPKITFWSSAMRSDAKKDGRLGRTNRNKPLTLALGSTLRIVSALGKVVSGTACEATLRYK